MSPISGLQHIVNTARRGAVSRSVRFIVALAFIMPMVTTSSQLTTSAATNYAFNFGPGSTYVQVNDAPELRLSNNFTIEAWVYMQDSVNETIIDKGPVYSYLFQVYPNGQSGLGLYASYGGVYNWVYSSAVSLPNNQWSHVAVTFTTGTNGLKFWVNGNLVSQHTPNGALSSSTGAMNLGRQEPGGCNCNRLQSRLDEVRIWSTVRTQAQLQSSMMIEPSVSAAGLVAYWDFNDGSGSTVRNRTSTTGLNGTIINFSSNNEWVDGVPRVTSGAAENGLGTALNNFAHGPTAQSASAPWQYFEIPDALTSATLLGDWQKTGNEIAGHQNQWDNNRTNGNYPFVQYIHSPLTSAFGGNAALMIHPDDSTRRAAVAWKNTTGATASIELSATVKLAYPANNSNGISYALHRNLSGDARYSSLSAGTMTTGSTSTVSLNETVEVQNGELVYLSVGNNGQYFWDHTIVTMSVAIATPTNSVAPQISGTAQVGETLNVSSGTWSGSPSSFAYQWKRSSSAGGTYTNITGANTNSYVATGTDAGDYLKVSVTATNIGGVSSPVLTTAFGPVIAPPATTTTTMPSPTTTASPVAVIDIQTPGTTVPQGQASIPTIAPNSVRPTNSSTTTTTTTTTPVSATIPASATSSVPPPTISDVKTGEAALDVDGKPSQVQVARENNQLVVTSQALKAVFSAQNNTGVARALDNEGNLRLIGGDAVKINIGILKAESNVDIWIFSTPVRLGTAVVGENGRVSGIFTIPASIKDGAHRIAVKATLPNGKAVTFTMGVVIGEPETSSTFVRTLIAIPIVVAVGFGLILPSQVRRRRRLRVQQ